jgi:hypothetical protein
MAEADTRSDASLTAARSDDASGNPDASPTSDASDNRRTHTAAAGARRDVRRGALIFVSVLVACTLAYLAIVVPGAWFPRASPKAWPVKELALTRGAGRVIGDELAVSAPDANGITLVTVTTNLRSSDYPGIAWIVANLREDADVRLLWRTDFQPDKLNSLPIRVEAGHTLPTIVAKDPAWIGQITGVALAIHGPLAQPVLIGGVVAKPMGAVETIADRWREWFAFEPWNGASINTITGGADNQQVPLPAVLAVLVGVSAFAAFVIRRRCPAAFTIALPGILAGFFLAGWLVLDARWTWNLLRQEHATAAQYGGKDLRDKHLASEDAPVFAFVQKALAVMPRTPVRLFIAADADYFRGRAAYHLYPHSVYFNPRDNALPPASAFHPGDWLLVFQRHGIQFDKSQGKLRWDGNQTVNAELKLLEPGAALFVIH